jgi:hypothetical protein
MPNKFRLLTLACAIGSLTATLWLWVYSTGGVVSYTMDSLTYRDAALNLLAGRPWMATNVVSDTPAYLPLAVWPPGYSSLWALTSFAFGLDIDVVPRILVPTLLVITTLSIFWIVMTMGGKPGVAGALAALHAFTPTSLAVFGHAWSETLSLPLCLLSFAAVLKYASANTTKSRLWWLAMTAFLIAMVNWTRYSAVVFIPLVFMTLLFLNRLPIMQRLGHAILFALLSLGFVLPLWVRNLQLTGSISGSDRGGAPRNVSDRFIDDIHTIFELFEQGLFSFDALLRANSEVPLFLLFFYLLLRALKLNGYRFLLAPSVWMPLLWVAGTVSFLLLARSLQTQLDMDYRMLAMTTPFCILVLVSPLQAATLPSPQRLTGLLVAVVMGLMINTGISEAHRVQENRAGGRNPNWRGKFALVYRDLSESSRSTRAIQSVLAGVSADTLVLTDYRGLFIRYLSNVRAFQVNNLAQCMQWAATNKAGVLLTGYSNPTFAHLPEGRWANECSALNPGWKVIQVTGRGSHSMMVD